jgi:competence protein ComEC
MRFIGTLTALWLYVDITGASPSAVRAFLMIALVETAWALRRPVNPAAALAFAALAALVVDPRQLFSASFQMSYGIVAAIVLLGLPLAETWQERAAVFRDLPKTTWSWPQRALEWLWRKTLAALALGFSTTLVSLVCGVLFFGLFTPGGLVANLVLIPVSSLVIFGGFASLLLGLAGLGAVGAHFNLAAALTLRGMELAVAGLLQAPGFFLEMEFRASWVGFAALGVVMAAIFAGYATRWEKRFGGFWTPFALTALALVLATKLR